MYDIREHVIMGKQTSSKECVLTCKEGTFLMPDAEVLVYRKQELHWMRTQQIGDGMKVLLAYPIRDLHNLSIQAIETGLSLYQEYDEDQDVWATYLYKYAGGEQGRDHINTYLREQGSALSVCVEKGFTRLVGASHVGELLQTYSSLGDQMACMIGICLGYGKPKQMSNDRILSRHVGLPLVGSVATLSPALEKLRDSIANQGIYMIRSLQHQHVGSLVQLTIHDEDLLDILEKIRLGKTSLISRNEQLTRKVSAFLGENDARLTNSVLKFVSK